MLVRFVFKLKAEQLSVQYLKSKDNQFIIKEDRKTWKHLEMTGGHFILEKMP